MTLIYSMLFPKARWLNSKVITSSLGVQIQTTNHLIIVIVIVIVITTR